MRRYGIILIRYYFVIDKSENILSFPNLTAEILYAMSVQRINPQYISFVPHLI